MQILEKHESVSENEEANKKSPVLPFLPWNFVLIS